MCGIAGIFALDTRPVPDTALPAMNAVLIHRGPDEGGLFCDGIAGLAMRRLSIIGLGNGRQPIFSEDGNVAIVMNGEIYNYRELKTALQSRGHAFKTDSDVEVAVHLYEERGADFVRDLHGMFAYALYDRGQRRLLLGRDRAGKKPLYYAEHDGLLLLASEIKALHASGLLPKELDPEALESYLAHGFVLGERTLFAGIRKLQAGCMLVASQSGIESRRYWDLPVAGNNKAPHAADVPSLETAAKRVRELLEEAVRIRLMSEVPLGAFLSGGVDSSAVVSIMSRQLENPVETFSVGFDHPDLDELAYAGVAARTFGTRHHEVLVQDCTPELLKEVNYYHDEPVSDSAAVPTFCLAKFARTHVTVALTGEGGDELFGGYRHYRLSQQLTALEARVTGMRSAASLLTRIEPHAHGWGPWRFWKAVWIASLPPAERPRAVGSIFTDSEMQQLLLPEFRSHNGNTYRERSFRALQERVRDVDCAAQAMYIDAKSQLADQLLMKVDKMTMAASLEARCPFLDQRLVEYVSALPTTLKVSPAGSKLILRAALRGVVPNELLDRPKRGFDVPLRRWLSGSLAPLVGDLMLAERTRLGAYVEASVTRHLWNHLRVHDDDQIARQLWTLLNLAVWLDQHWPAHGAARDDRALGEPRRSQLCAVS